MEKQELPRITEEEIAIIKRAQAGDESAFNWIFYKYRDFVANILYGYINDWDEAQDITNVVFLKVHNKLSKFTTYDSFGGWLRILTNRTAIDYLRQTNNKRLTLSNDDVRLTSSEHVGFTEDELVNRMTVRQIFNLLDKMDPIIKQIFEMFYIDNMTVDKISQELRLPTGTIKSHLARTRKKIKTQLNLSQQ